VLKADDPQPIAASVKKRKEGSARDTDIMECSCSKRRASRQYRGTAGSDSKRLGIVVGGHQKSDARAPRLGGWSLWTYDLGGGL
jgi:hypothetical protein